jgi:hypothetical protein
MCVCVCVGWKLECRLSRDYRSSKALDEEAEGLAQQKNGER